MAPTWAATSFLKLGTAFANYKKSGNFFRDAFLKKLQEIILYFVKTRPIDDMRKGSLVQIRSCHEWHSSLHTYQKPSLQ